MFFFQVPKIPEFLFSLSDYFSIEDAFTGAQQVSFGGGEERDRFVYSLVPYSLIVNHVHLALNIQPTFFIVGWSGWATEMCHGLSFISARLMAGCCVTGSEKQSIIHSRGCGGLQVHLFPAWSSHWTHKLLPLPPAGQGRCQTLYEPEDQHAHSHNLGLTVANCVARPSYVNNNLRLFRVIVIIFSLVRWLISMMPCVVISLSSKLHNMQYHYNACESSHVWFCYDCWLQC